MKRIPRKVWIPAVSILAVALYLFIYNRPVELQKAVLMSTPLIYRDGMARPYDVLPEDLSPPDIKILYATDRQPTDNSILQPMYYGNDRSMRLFLGQATVRFGNGDMLWEEIEKTSLEKDRDQDIPLQIIKTNELHRIGSPEKSLDASLKERTDMDDPFIAAVSQRLSLSDENAIYIFVPGFKVDFAYPVLVAAELWHYLGYSGAFIAYSWPSRQRIRDYFSDVETAAFTAQHFRMLLIYLTEKTDVDRIHILCYSAGARIVSQALHELRLMTHGLPVSEIDGRLNLGRVIFAAPDIDMMLFAARYRDGFEDISESITIYTNANDTALNWALRFFGWPRLGAPGELGLTPEDLKSLRGLKKTSLVDVAAAEETASGNGHGYFIKSPWVSTDILLTLRYGMKPKKRGLIRNAGEAVWEFPQNYPQNIK